MKLEDLNIEYDKLQKRYGAKEYKKYKDYRKNFE